MEPAIFRARTQTFLDPTEFEELWDEAKLELIKQFDDFIALGSGATLKQIDWVSCEMYLYKPIRGGSFIPTPQKYALKRAIVNPQVYNHLHRKAQ